MALDFPVGTDFPANGNQIPDGHEYSGFYWDATVGVWKRVCDGGLYVEKAGDTMTGALVMDNASEILMKNTDLDFGREGRADVNGDWDPAVNRFSHIESLPPRLIQPDGTSAGDTSKPFGIRVEIDDGNTFNNQFKVGNRNGDALTITGGIGPSVNLGSGFPGNQDKVEPGYEGHVRIKGIPTPDYGTADPTVAVNKEYVDQRDEILQQEIIELEEEIDAIAPSLERGKWRFTAVGTVAQPGQFTMYDADFGSGAPTGLFKSAKSIWFNETDSDGIAHAFGDVDDGELLQIFIDGSPEFGLYEVVGAAHDETDGATSFWVIDVNFIRTNEDTTAVAPSELCRFKVFMAPSGGAAGDFVMKTGDEMAGPGPLVIKTTKTDINYNTAGSNTAFIRFQNDNNGTKRTTDLYLAGGNSSRLCVNYDFLSKGAVYSNGYFYAHNGTDASDAKIYLNSTSGNLRYGGINQLSWDASEITAFEAIKFDDLSKNTDSDHAIHKGYVDKAIQAAGLQLGSFNYKRNGDPFQTGHIRSNATTNPASITQLEIHQTNDDGIAWGTELYEAVIREKMYVHFVDKGVSNYTGRITNIEIMTNGVKLTLTPMTGLITGSVYLNNKYDVFIGHNKFGFKYPE